LVVLQLRYANCEDQRLGGKWLSLLKPQGSSHKLTLKIQDKAVPNQISSRFLQPKRGYKLLWPTPMRWSS
jgi:hypothetical protein